MINFYKINLLFDIILLLIFWILAFITVILQKEYVFVIILKITFFYLIFTQLINYIIRQSWQKKVI